jgi:uncharacterized membrane protein
MWWVLRDRELLPDYGAVAGDSSAWKRTLRCRSAKPWMQPSVTQDASPSLRGGPIRVLDDRVANPAYILLLVTGLGMVWVGGIPITTFWIALALALYAVLVVLGLGVFSPALRRQIAVVDAGTTDTTAYEQAARRTTLSGALLVVVALIIVFLMVTKPTL